MGDNTLNAMPEQELRYIQRGEYIRAKFIFTMPLLTAGEYTMTVSIAEGSRESHTICHWINEAIVLQSTCSNIAAGLAGVPMHLIKMEYS